jgi:predicted trehalose synthase
VRDRGLPREAVVPGRLLFVELAYAGGETAVNLLPLHFSAQDEGRRVMEECPAAVVARLHVDGHAGTLYDGMYHEGFRKRLFEIISRKTRVKVKGGVLTSSQGRTLKVLPGDTVQLASQVLRESPETTSVIFDNIFFFKLYRRMAEGTDPEAEVGRFLTDTVDFAGISPFRDVAEMMRSFHYAVYPVLREKAELTGCGVPLLEPWAETWYRYACGIFLQSYLSTVSDALFVPRKRDDLEIMLAAFLLHRAAAELKHELEARSDLVIIPLRGIRNIIESPLDRGSPYFSTGLNLNN